MQPARIQDSRRTAARRAADVSRVRVVDRAANGFVACEINVGAMLWACREPLAWPRIDDVYPHTLDHLPLDMLADWIALLIVNVARTLSRRLSFLVVHDPELLSGVACTSPYDLEPRPAATVVDPRMPVWRGHGAAFHNTLAAHSSGFKAQASKTLLEMLPPLIARELSRTGRSVDASLHNFVSQQGIVFAFSSGDAQVTRYTRPRDDHTSSRYRCTTTSVTKLNADPVLTSLRANIVAYPIAGDQPSTNRVVLVMPNALMRSHYMDLDRAPGLFVMRELYADNDADLIATHVHRTYPDSEGGNERAFAEAAREAARSARPVPHTDDMRPPLTVFNDLGRYVHGWRPLPANVPLVEELDLPHGNASTQWRALEWRHPSVYSDPDSRAAAHAHDARRTELRLWHTALGQRLVRFAVRRNIARTNAFLALRDNRFTQFPLLADGRPPVFMPTVVLATADHTAPDARASLVLPLGTCPLTPPQFEDVHDVVRMLMCAALSKRPALERDGAFAGTRDSRADAQAPFVNYALAVYVLLLGPNVRLLERRRWLQRDVPSVNLLDDVDGASTLPCTPLSALVVELARKLPDWFRAADAPTVAQLAPDDEHATLAPSLMRALMQTEATVPVHMRLFRNALRAAWERVVAEAP